MMDLIKDGTGIGLLIGSMTYSHVSGFAISLCHFIFAILVVQSFAFTTISLISLFYPLNCGLCAFILD